jgi:hypothetical protein
MTTTERPVVPVDAQPYLAAVRQLLWSLPADERDELLDDLSAHLAELAAEDGPPLRERLGTPSAYAADFVASAGVEPTTARRITMPSVHLPESVQARWTALRPAWLVLRPFAIVFAGAELLRDGFFGDANAAAVVVLGLLAIALVSTSQHLTGTWDRLATVAGAIGVLVVVGAFSHGRQITYVDRAGWEPNGILQRGDGSTVSNIWAYDTDGNPVDVFLFDQNGRPLDDIGFDGFDDRTGDQLRSEPRRDANGAPIANLFPREQHRSGRYGDEIDPAPAVSTPRLRSSTTTSTSVPATTTSTTGPPSTP